jgi:hypothetical protein
LRDHNITVHQKEDHVGANTTWAALTYKAKALSKTGSWGGAGVARGRPTFLTLQTRPNEVEINMIHYETDSFCTAPICDDPESDDNVHSVTHPLCSSTKIEADRQYQHGATFSNMDIKTRNRNRKL